ncbi:hypothetical protein BDQ17DRAFT_1332950 [Cyathus striatus]|nr:hypothetical protein BDQ17DRAFT_1332950 [Cyathus striatus]
MAYAVETHIGFFSLNREEAERFLYIVLANNLDKLGMMTLRGPVNYTKVVTGIFCMDRVIAEKLLNYFLDENGDAIGMIKKERYYNITEYPEEYKGKKIIHTRLYGPERQYKLEELQLAQKK